MKQTDLQFFRSYLLNEKSSILNKTAEFRNEQREGLEKCLDEAELASSDLQMNLSIHLQERDRSSLLQIERALGKIAEGTYGQCELCSEQIDVRRLKARPFTTLCIDCMEEQEDSRQPLH